MSVQLWGLRKRGDFCDVVIRVQGTSVKCHKLVLVACSDYFASMFNTSHQFRENREGLSEVSLEADIYQVTIYYDIYHIPHIPGDLRGGGRECSLLHLQRGTQV